MLRRLIPGDWGSFVDTHRFRQDIQVDVVEFKKVITAEPPSGRHSSPFPRTSRCPLPPACAAALCCCCCCATEELAATAVVSARARVLHKWFAMRVSSFKTFELFARVSARESSPQRQRDPAAEGSGDYRDVHEGELGGSPSEERHCGGKAYSTAIPRAARKCLRERVHFCFRAPNLFSYWF